MGSGCQARQLYTRVLQLTAIMGEMLLFSSSDIDTRNPLVYVLSKAAVSYKAELCSLQNLKYLPSGLERKSSCTHHCSRVWRKHRTDRKSLLSQGRSKSLTLLASSLL